MCWLLSSRLCWTYLLGAAELAVSSFSSWTSLEKHTLRWLRVPLDTKPSSSSLGRGERLQRHIQTFQVIINKNFLRGYSCKHGQVVSSFVKSLSKAKIESGKTLWREDVIVNGSTIDARKDGRVSTSSHYIKMNPKYHRYRYRHLLQVMFIMGQIHC